MGKTILRSFEELFIPFTETLFKSFISLHKAESITEMAKWFSWWEFLGPPDPQPVGLACELHVNQRMASATWLE